MDRLNYELMAISTKFKPSGYLLKYKTQMDIYEFK